jgi:hypothetical protein
MGARQTRKQAQKGIAAPTKGREEGQHPSPCLLRRVHRAEHAMHLHPSHLAQVAPSLQQLLTPLSLSLSLSLSLFRHDGATHARTHTKRPRCPR